MEQYKKDIKKMMRNKDPLKKIISQLKKDVELEIKPWGTSKRYCLNRKCTVNIINLQKGRKIEQTGSGYDRLWIVLDDNVTVEVNGKLINPKKNHEILIHKEATYKAFAFNKDGRVIEIIFGKTESKDKKKSENIHIENISRVI